MDVNKLKKIIPWQQLRVIERSTELKQVLEDMANSIDHIPAIYETDGADDAKCVLHYFDIESSADWYVFEVDFDSGEMFGFATLSGDIADHNAEFGYIDLDDLISLGRINLDMHFDGITKSEIKLERYGKTA